MLFAGGFAILSVRQRVAANHPTTAVMGKPERCLDRSTGIVTCFSRLYNPGSVHWVSVVRLHISAEIGLLSLAQWVGATPHERGSTGSLCLQGESHAFLKFITFKPAQSIRNFRTVTHERFQEGR